MAKSIVVDDSKVMDVSKPGKGKIVTTSRPVVAPVASDTYKKADNASPVMPDTEEAKPLVPSAAKKVIQPLTEDEKPAESASSSEAADGSSAQAESVQTDNPEQKTSEEKAPAESKPADAAPEDSDAAGVDALAESVNSKKEAAKKAEEQAKKDAEVQALIDSKKYVVPIGHDGPGNKKAGKKGSGLLLTLILLIVIALTTAYLLIDAEVIDIGYEVPFEIIK